VIAPDNSDETFIDLGSTDENGQIIIPAQYSGYTVVASIVAGQTKDSDNVGYVAQSYEMRSAESATVVTPYTTLAAISDSEDLASIAATLGLSEDDISGDYTTNTEAHLIAQLLAEQLDTDNNDDDAGTLVTIAEAASSYLAGVDTDTTSLEDIELTVDESGTVNAREAIASLSDYLEDSDTSTPFYFASLDGNQYIDEGVTSASYVDGAVTY
jgi:hypothetical protein